MNAFSFSFAYGDLNFRRHIKLGTHPAFFLAKIISFSKKGKKNKKTEEKEQVALILCILKTFYCDVSQNVSRNLNVLAFP